MAAGDICMIRASRPLGQLLHAHAQMVLSQQILKFIFSGKGNSGKKDQLLRSGGLMHCRCRRTTDTITPDRWSEDHVGRGDVSLR